MHRHPHFVKSLVDYIIREPKDDESDFKVCYKYPFVSSEILGCEILGLIKSFFEDAAEGDSHLSLSKNFDQISQESGTNKDPDDDDSIKRSESVGLKKEKVAELKEEMGIFFPRSVIETPPFFFSLIFFSRGASLKRRRSSFSYLFSREIDCEGREIGHGGHRASRLPPKLPGDQGKVPESDSGRLFPEGAQRDPEQEGLRCTFTGFYIGGHSCSR